MNSIPQGWEIKTLGEVCEINPKNKLDDDLEVSFIPMNLIADKYQNKFSYEIRKWSEVKKGYTHLQNHCIAIAKITPCFENGKCVILQDLKNGYGAGTTELIVVLADKNKILQKFIFYFFNTTSFTKEGVKNFKGTAGQLRISKDFITNLQIPLPPLATQKLIVEKLENAFAHIDEAVRHLKSVQTNIPRLKSSLLHCAFSGKLTESQNQSHKVQTLKKRVVGEEGETLPFEPLHPLIKTEIPQGWEIKTLGEIGKVISGGTPSTSNKDNFDGEIAWITPADLSGYKEKYISKGKRNLSEQGLKNSSARLLPPNSILFSSRAPIGYVAIASNALCTNQGFKNLIPNGNVSSEYIYYFLLHSKRLAESVASGTTFKEISAASFSKLPIPLPPLATQNQIVQILESKFAHLEKLAQFVNASLENLQRLKSSLLNQAFKGELV
ncbi:restriction endonuclease subunit S [uncultured Helicobacter sp.]|uniref:restriction endonuclease subunit S n=1 Tax=uncultured Helicobacter sp. TaxID=175537 RepID=UPI00260EF969|nr:restriction endonuclease subunit S [uncultured Helicobacter sp.]